MSQRVPNWELDDHVLSHHHHAPPPSSGVATSANYDVTELTWNVVDNLTTLGHVKPIPRYPSSAAADAAAASTPAVGGAGTHECIVDQGHSGTHHSSAADAMVPCSVAGEKKQSSQGSETPAAAAGRKKSKPSPSAPSVGYEDEERCGGGGGGSPEMEKGSFTGEKPLGVDDHDSDNHHALNSQDELGSRRITSSSIKRGREAAIHNQSERKRRDRINQKMKTLQKLLPNSRKADKASMLDEVIEYLKLLQAQVQMMSRMNTIPTIMLPFAMQHQLSKLAQMTQTTRMAMSLGMIDPSLLNLAPPPPILHPSTFPPLPSTAEWMQQPSHRLLPDIIPAFMSCPPQQLPMNSEAYSRMAALYQQLYQQSLGSNQKT